MTKGMAAALEVGWGKGEVMKNFEKEWLKLREKMATEYIGQHPDDPFLSSQQGFRDGFDAATRLKKEQLKVVFAVAGQLARALTTKACAVTHSNVVRANCICERCKALIRYRDELQNGEHR